MTRRRFPFRRWFLLLGAAGTLLAAAPEAQAAGLTVVAPSGSGAEGTEVSLPIRMTATTSVGALEMALVFDPNVLAGISVTKGSLAENGLLESGSGPGRLRVAFASLDGAKGDGELFVAKFRVVGQNGQKTAIALQNVQAWETSIEPKALVVTTQDGAFNVAHAGGSFPWFLPAIAGGLFASLLLLLLTRRHRRSKGSATVAPPASVPRSADGVPVGPPPGGPPAPTWAPTHVVPPAGLDAYADVDPAPGAVARLDPGLPVQVVERRGDWARVVCANTWTAWVDAQLLTPQP